MKAKDVGFWAIPAVMASLLAAPVANWQTERFSTREVRNDGTGLRSLSTPG